jgi:hypothetical protein
MGEVASLFFNVTRLIVRGDNSIDMIFDGKPKDNDCLVQIAVLVGLLNSPQL